MSTDDDKRRALITAGWCEGESENNGWWWKFRAAGWARMLDEAYNTLCSDRQEQRNDESDVV